MIAFNEIEDVEWIDEDSTDTQVDISVANDEREQQSIPYSHWHDRAHLNLYTVDYKQYCRHFCVGFSFDLI